MRPVKHPHRTPHTLPAPPCARPERNLVVAYSTLSIKQPISVDAFAFVRFALKGGDPAAPSDTATLLRLHPSHESYRGNRPPCG